jgi:hypothetical protein
VLATPEPAEVLVVAPALADVLVAAGAELVPDVDVLEVFEVFEVVVVLAASAVWVMPAMTETVTTAPATPVPTAAVRARRTSRFLGGLLFIAMTMGPGALGTPHHNVKAVLSLLRSHPWELFRARVGLGSAPRFREWAVPPRVGTFQRPLAPELPTRARVTAGPGRG